MNNQLLEFEQLFQWALRYGQPLNDGYHTMVTSRVLQQFIQEVPNAQYIMQRAQELNYLSPTGDPNIFAIPDDILRQYSQLVGFSNPQGAPGHGQGRIDQYSSYDAQANQGGGYDPYGGDDYGDDGYDDDDYYDDGVDEWYDEDDSRSLIYTGVGIGAGVVSVLLALSSSTIFALLGGLLGIGAIVVSGLAIKEAMDYDESGIKKAIPAIGIIFGLLSVLFAVIGFFNAPASPEQLQGEETEELVVEEPEEKEPEIVGEEEEQAEVLPPISDDYRENVSIEIAPVEHMQDQTGMIFTRLPLTITNIRSTPLSYDIQLQAMDEEGEFIGSPEFVISVGLEPGETTERYAYEYLTNDLAIAITQPGVRFEIIDVSTSHLTRSEIPEDNTVVNPVDDLDIPEDLDPRNQNESDPIVSEEEENNDMSEDGLDGDNEEGEYGH